MKVPNGVHLLIALILLTGSKMEQRDALCGQSGGVGWAKVEGESREDL